MVYPSTKLKIWLSIGGDIMKTIAKVIKWIFEKLKRKKPIELNIQSINYTIILTIHKKKKKKAFTAIIIQQTIKICQ